MYTRFQNQGGGHVQEFPSIQRVKDQEIEYEKDA